jgi:hypothetical protein
MKKLLSLIFTFLLIGIYSFAQVPPEGINYQAIARDTTGKAISSNISLTITFSIYSQFSGGTLLFSESHNSVHTNRYGLFTLIIGSVDSLGFEAINWSTGTKFLEVQVYDGTTTVTMPRTQMMSVPYALYAKTSGGTVIGATGATGFTGGIGVMGVTGSTGSPGLIGLTGNSGLTGDIGITGSTGATGDIGSTGYTGATGYTGVTGYTGLTGYTGSTGATGPVGCASTNYIMKSNGTNATCTVAPIFENGSGKVGIGNSSPNTRVDITGDIATRENHIVLSGNTDNLSIGNSTFIRITGPSANYEITGFAGGVDGKILIVANNTSSSVKFKYADGGSLVANQLILYNSADVTVAQNGGVIFIYSAAISKWIMIGNSRP